MHTKPKGKQLRRRPDQGIMSCMGSQLQQVLRFVEAADLLVPQWGFVVVIIIKLI